jgi:DNA-binding transcriptional ArsR family regulator
MNPNVHLVMMGKALSCPTRLYVLQTLGAEGCTVSQVAETANISKTAAVYHLARLVAVGLATMTWRGRTRVFRWSKERWHLACELADA